MKTSTPNDKIEEMAKEAHIKWLSKAKTSKIDGSELTVLPYGYLQTAVKEALKSQEKRVREEVEKEWREKITKKEKELMFSAENGFLGTTLNDEAYNDGIKNLSRELLKDN